MNPNSSFSPNTPKPRGVFFVLGASGSGKGTLAKCLLETGRIQAHVSMGDVLRARLTAPNLETELSGDVPNGFSSRRAFLQHAVQSGLLIPDAWTERIIESELQEILPNLLWAFDGYPRSPAAAKHLLNALEHRGIPCLGVVHLFLDFQLLEQRLLARGRTDDSHAAIANRFAFYQQSVLPALEVLVQHTRVLELDATFAPKELADSVWKWLHQ